MGRGSWELFGRVFVLPLVVACGACNGDETSAEEPLACDIVGSRWADGVVSYEPTIAGGDFPGHPNFDNPADALGAPDYHGDGFGVGAVALGYAGVLDLEFTDCHMTTSGDSRVDLVVFEAGDALETLHVALRPVNDPGTIDPELAVGDGFYVLIDNEPGRTEVDVDAVLGLDAPMAFDRVRIVDDPFDGSHGSQAPGADLDSIEYRFAVYPED